MIEKGQRLHPGDILRNDWTSEINPSFYTMYIKRGKVGKCPTFDCLAYDGRMTHHGVQDNRLVVVGHLEEYDEFIKALSHIGTHESRRSGMTKQEMIQYLKNLAYHEREYLSDVLNNAENPHEIANKLEEAANMLEEQKTGTQT